MPDIEIKPVSASPDTRASLGEMMIEAVAHGGSVKPSNAAELMAVANVNGALVGGASLKAADFLAIAAGC